jgi:hypothetical protein
MSAWIDVVVYATQFIMFCLVLPRWSARFARATIIDRNSQWAASNPAVLERAARGSGWLKFIQAVGVSGVLLLFVAQLYLQPVVLKIEPAAQWRLLMSIDYSVMIVAMLVYSAAFAYFTRWLKRDVPPAEQRQATLSPRKLDEFIPRWLHLAGLVLLAAAVLARPVASELFAVRHGNLLGGFLSMLLVSSCLLLGVAGSVARKPTVLDRVYGPAYRRREVQVTFGLMIAWAAFMLAALYFETAGIDISRYFGVLTSILATTILALLMPLPPPEPAGSGPGKRSDCAVA